MTTRREFLAGLSAAAAVAVLPPGPGATTPAPFTPRDHLPPDLPPGVIAWEEAERHLRATSRLDGIRVWMPNHQPVVVRPGDRITGCCFAWQVPPATYLVVDAPAPVDRRQWALVGSCTFAVAPWEDDLWTRPFYGRFPPKEWQDVTRA